MEGNRQWTPIKESRWGVYARWVEAEIERLLILGTDNYVEGDKYDE